MEAPQRRPFEFSSNRAAQAAINEYLAQLRCAEAAAQSALMALDRGRLDDAHAGLLTARERLVEAVAGLDGAILEIEQLQPGRIAQ
jgi:hypothetical protein